MTVVHLRLQGTGTTNHRSSWPTKIVSISWKVDKTPEWNISQWDIWASRYCSICNRKYPPNFCLSGLVSESNRESCKWFSLEGSVFHGFCTENWIYGLFMQQRLLHARCQWLLDYLGRPSKLVGHEIEDLFKWKGSEYSTQFIKCDNSIM